MNTNVGLLFLRITVGLTMLIAHGWPKLANFTVISTKFPDPIGLGSQVSLALAVFSEVFCSVAIIAGIFTRWAAIPLLITMLVAFFLVHGGDPWKVRELSFMYGLVYIMFIICGGGKYSVKEQ